MFLWNDEMQKLLIFLLLAATTIWGAGDTPAFVAPAKMVAPLFNVNKDDIGPSIFLIVKGSSQEKTVFWTVDDAKVLLAKIQLMEDEKKRAVALRDIKKFMAAGLQKYEINTALGNRLAIMFNVFEIPSRSLADYADWFVFNKNLLVLSLDDDACLRIAEFVDPYAFGPQKQITENRLLSKDDFVAALALKKDFMKQPFAFFYKPKAFLPVSFTTVKRFAKGAAAVVGVTTVAVFLNNVRTWSNSLGNIIFTSSQEKLLKKAAHLNGPSVALYCLHRGKDVWYAPCTSSLSFTVKKVGDSLAIASSDRSQAVFDEGSFWLPDQVWLLVDMVQNDPTLLAPYGKRLFSDETWLYDKSRSVSDFEKFRALVRVLLPSIDGQDSGEGAAEKVLEYVVDAAAAIPQYVMSKPSGIAIKGAVGLVDNLDVGLTRVKNWANFVMWPTRSAVARKKAECQLTHAEKKSQGVSYFDLYKIVCEMLVAVSETSGSPSINVPDLDYLSKYSFSKLAPYKFSDVVESELVFYDRRFASAEKISKINYDAGLSLQGTYLFEIPPALIYGSGFKSFGPFVSPFDFNITDDGLAPGFVPCDDLSELEKNAIKIARAQDLSAFPYFGEVVSRPAGDGLVDSYENGFESVSPSGAAASGVVGGAPRRVAAAAQALPAWVYTSYSNKKYLEVLPSVFSARFSETGRYLDHNYLWSRVELGANKDPLFWYLTHPPKLNGNSFVRLRFEYHSADAKKRNEEDVGPGESVWVYSYDETGTSQLIFKRFYDKNGELLRSENSMFQGAVVPFYYANFAVGRPSECSSGQLSIPFQSNQIADLYQLPNEEVFNYQKYQTSLRSSSEKLMYEICGLSNHAEFDLYKFVLKNKKSVEYCDFRLLNQLAKLDHLGNAMLAKSLWRSSPDSYSWRNIKAAPSAVTSVDETGSLKIADSSDSAVAPIVWMRSNGINLYPYLRFVGGTAQNPTF